MVGEENQREAIYRVLNSVPEGSLVSYGQLAEMAGMMKQARQVGRILSQLPNDTELPWHRVVNAGGRISFAKGSPGYQRQLERLCEEGSALPSGQLLWRERRWQP